MKTELYLVRDKATLQDFLQNSLIHEQHCNINKNMQNKYICRTGTRAGGAFSKMPQGAEVGAGAVIKNYGSGSGS
jgi:hypothetical protein